MVTCVQDHQLYLSDVLKFLNHQYICASQGRCLFLDDPVSKNSSAVKGQAGEPVELPELQVGWGPDDAQGNDIHGFFTRVLSCI